MNHRLFMAVAAVAAAAVPASAQTVKTGIEAWQRSDFEGAVRIWRPLAEKGDPDAQFDLGQAYRLGKGVPINLAAAQTWLERAADQGHVDAQTTLGLLLFQSGNRISGIRWLKTAADKNDARAMLVYGTALFNGDGVTQNPALGYAYVARAAAHGLAAAKDTQSQMDQVVSVDDRRRAATLIADVKVAPKPVAKAAAAKIQNVAAVKPVQEKAAIAKAAPALSRKPAATPVAAPTPSGNWRVQLGAFSQRSSAETLFRKLSASRALAGRSPAYVSAGPVVRLQVGPFESKATAASACRALTGHGQACFPVPAK